MFSVLKQLIYVDSKEANKKPIKKIGFQFLANLKHPVEFIFGFAFSNIP